MKNFLRKLTGLNPKSLEKGFSLAEAMVAVAILGIVITATLSQLELSSKSTLDMAADAEINNVTNKIIAAIGTTSVCRDNFGGKAQNNNTYTFIKDSNGDYLIQNNVATGSGNSVKVLSIETKRVSDNEMNLVISFQKKRSTVNNIFASGPKREIPINTILTTAAPIVIQDCFANYDLVIRTAIQQSCKGLASKYNPNINLPYGACEHSVTTLTAANTSLNPIACPAGQFLKTVKTTSGEIEYTCGKFTEDCLPGQAISGFDGGVVQCDYIFPVCAPGQIIMEIGGANVCKPITCAPPPLGNQTVLSAFRGFYSGGNPLCTPITTAAQCQNGQYATNITDEGTVTCSNALLIGGACPIGKYINGVDANGYIRCDTYIAVPAICPNGFAVTGIKDDGSLDCEIKDAALRCGGSTRTYNECETAGGVVRNRGSATSHCEFDGESSCPLGWSRCGNYGRQWEVTCRDTANTFYCNQWTQERPVYPVGGNNAYLDTPLAPGTCHLWTGSAGTQGRCEDNPGAGPTVYTRQKSVGCK